MTNGMGVSGVQGIRGEALTWSPVWFGGEGDGRQGICMTRSARLTSCIYPQFMGMRLVNQGPTKENSVESRGCGFYINKNKKNS